MTIKYSTVSFENHELQIANNNSVIWIKFADYVGATGGAKESSSSRLRLQKEITPSLETAIFSNPGGRPNAYVKLVDLHKLKFRLAQHHEASERLNEMLVAHFAGYHEQNIAQEPKEHEVSVYPIGPGEPLKMFEGSVDLPAEAVAVPEIEFEEEPITGTETVPFAIPDYIDSMDRVTNRLDYLHNSLDETTYVIESLHKRINSLQAALDERSMVIVNMNTRLEAVEGKQAKPNSGSIADILSQLGVKLTVVSANA